MTPGYKKKFVPVAIGLSGADLDAARKIAEDRGIGYEAYIKSRWGSRVQNTTSTVRFSQVCEPAENFLT